MYTRFFDTISKKDISIVGGKNASLGEMFKALKKKKIHVPNGFATTSEAYFKFLKKNNLDKEIFKLLKKINDKNLTEIAKEIRNLILKQEIPEDLKREILSAYRKLSKKYNKKHVDVAVRSSATAEDLPTASFAGQLESFLNIVGEKNLLIVCKKCFASLFTDRAIAYRIRKKFNHEKIALSIGIQKMVRSDLACSGVLFTLDTETGFKDVITISASVGLGENIVQGKVIPDMYQVFKPFLNKNKDPIIEKKLGSKRLKLIYSKQSVKNIKTSEKERTSFTLTDKEVILLSKWAKDIENHYKGFQDIEWAKDGKTNKLYIVQARPETVQSQIKKNVFHKYKLLEKKEPIMKGIAIGESIAFGKVQIIKSIKEINKFQKGSILVTPNTTPDWVPIMKIAKGIITDQGGKTSHAAIVSRELSIPAIVGTSIATKKLTEGQVITINCSEGDVGFIYNKKLKYQTIEEDLSELKKIKTPLMINISSPEAAFKWWQLPIKGIGLTRLEFIISNIIKIHPMALLYPEKTSSAVRKKIDNLTKNYENPKQYFIELLSKAVAKIAASQYPNKVIVRLSDFKTNEYESLIGGRYFEEKEKNPMLGFRGAFRYYSEEYKKAFKLECMAFKKAKDMGFDNIIVMIPFCRTIAEAHKVKKLLKENKITKDIYVMCEIPSNVFLADKFSKIFDGFSIGTNDLTQLILGVDRDSSKLSSLSDPRDEAVKIAIKEIIKKAHKNNCKVGICGQAPSDYPEFAQFLIKQKIDSISLNPDSIIKIIKKLS